VRFEFIAKHRGTWRTSELCEALGVSRGGFYDWLKRPESQRSRDNRHLTVQVRTSFEQSDQTYGSPRVWRDLRAWGYRCGVHRVARLMLAAGLQARRKRPRLPFDSGVRPEHAIAPNLLDRQFEATAPNQRWVADFTYIWTQEGWLYFAVVLDLFSRRIVGWSMSTQMTAQLVTDALTMALWRRGRPKELLHHSDQGSQYASELFQRLLSEHGITCSMSRSGNVWDNSAMESFFSSLKTERVHRKVYCTRDEARADVFDYVERFYNLRRRHSTLGYLSPAEYETTAASA
jgi:putative transposase